MKMRSIILAGLLGSTMLAGTALAADTSKVPLVTAAKQGDREAVRSLLNGIPQKVIAGPEGTAALVWAVSRNDGEMVDQLLRASQREISPAAARTASLSSPCIASSSTGAALTAVMLMAATMWPSPSRTGAAMALTPSSKKAWLTA